MEPAIWVGAGFETIRALTSPARWLLSRITRHGDKAGNNHCNTNLASLSIGFSSMWTPGLKGILGNNGT